ncbi:Rrf2 family transcriptional regulator [Actimicrobium sp. CCC2.4]|uniref:RrF2 family transcriptional regulator n=1 Tax=Actimicrobium sp. CCC2.4 TaxID=3048606 RepID=UPI002AC9BED5|nr:Rrf2 family transcriptional regulator [Actimicrobium sp. CCC2.4]MEB0136361.1 Rrf2 family transcriptional regulator [Actimicrobium sp. CCC2.4]WPX31180.1 Rrf2 family transcriptional regulator [Actimicrobium sp. CCC2.4]
MRLTRYSDIGLRVLIYLARAGTRESPVTVAEIAAQFDIPINHLIKVAGHLARTHWVDATRGRNGGLRLAVDASTLQVGIILLELEGKDELIDCDGLACHLRKDCILRDALKIGLQAFYDAMNTYTLADLCKGKTGEQIVQMHRTFLAQ